MVLENRIHGGQAGATGIQEEPRGKRRRGCKLLMLLKAQLHLVLELHKQGVAKLISNVGQNYKWSRFKIGGVGSKISAAIPGWLKSWFKKDPLYWNY